ncbi:HK97 family phage prohead protease [Lachnospiraceae bacterium LCP25S3_G4]
MSRETDNIEKLMADKNVEFREFKLTKIETRKNEDDTESLVIEGVPCVFDTETILYKGKHYEYREKIDKGAFNGADMTDVIFNFNHCGRVYSRTRNKSLELEVKKDGLHMISTLMGDDEGHAQLYRDIKSGLIDKMSFAFSVKESTYESIERSDGLNVEIRTVTKIDKLYDVSAVDIPAYDTTTISARNVFDAEREKREAESEKRAKELLKLKLKLEGVF